MSCICLQQEDDVYYAIGPDGKPREPDTPLQQAPDSSEEEIEQEVLSIHLSVRLFVAYSS